MTTRDQLELISPTGEIKFYTLDPARGITNIGRHPDNDIVIDSPDVSAFHAAVYHWQKPIQIILMGADGKTTVGGQPIQSRTSHPLQNWDTIELDGYTLVLMEGAAAGAPVSGPAAAAPLPTPPLPAPAAPSVAALTPMPLPAAAPQAESPLAAATVVVPAPLETMAAPMPDHVDEVVVTEVSAREFALDVDQTATFDVLIANGGDIVATFMVSVEGLDPYWVLVSPAQVNLNEGERATVQVTITPPRAPTSRAGLHNFGVTVSSPDYPGRFSRTAATLTVNPYYDHAIGELSPKQQRYSWFKRTGQVTYTVANRGNSEAPFRIDANDDERACLFEFKLSEGSASLARQAELRLQPEESRTVTVIMTLLKRRFFGLSDNYYSYTVTTTPLQGQLTPRSMLGQAQSSALIGMWHIIAVLLLLAVLIAFIFRPGISDFSADLPQVLSSEIMDGQKVTLSWQTSWFSHVTIDQGVGAIESSEASVEVAPLDTTTYRLTATTRLLDLIARNWFSASREITVVVDPVEPIVRFNVDKDKVVIGQSVTISWQVLNAEEVVLLINGAPETLPPAQHTGSRVIAPEGETQVTLQARNRYTTGDGIVTTRIINAARPTETPLPPPVIQRFDVLPSPIIEGEEVTLEWSVVGVSEVTIEGLGPFPPSGRLIEKPTTTTAYRLIATNGQQTAISLKEVVVNPAPTPTPVPGTPRIEFFTVTPSEVSVGSAEASNVKLAWSVTGDVTNIQLEGGSLGKIAGLSRQGSQTISVDKTTQFTLTAFNGSLTASQTATITVNVPVPVISGLSPASTTVGGPSFTLTVTGSNFVSNSVARWDGVDHSTTFVSDTQLLAAIADTDISATGSYNITVFNPSPGGGASAPAIFKVTNPLPTISSISPGKGTAGTKTNVTLTVAGTGFVTDSVVRWDGADVATTFLSSTQLKATIPAANLATAKTYPITVFNPAPVGGISSPVNFDVENPVPIVNSISSTSIVRHVANDPDFSLTILGDNFLDSSVVLWGGVPIPTSYSGPKQVTGLIPNANLLVAGTFDITVTNPAPGGGSDDAPTPFTITNPPTAANLTQSVTTAKYGQAVDFTTSVSSSVFGSITGYVRVIVDGLEADTVQLSGGSPSTAIWTTSGLNVGSHTVNVQYLGDTNYGPSAYSPPAANPLSLTVEKADTATTAVTASPPATVYGQSVTFSTLVSIVSPGGGSLNGTVVFKDGVTILATVAVSGPPPVAGITVTTPGIANLSAATHSITAEYQDSTGNYNNSPASSPLIFTVSKADVNITSYTCGSASCSDSTYGEPLTLWAYVTVVAPGGNLLDGEWVDFYQGFTLLGSAQIGAAYSGYSNWARLTNVSSTAFAPGSLTITATFGASSTGPPAHLASANYNVNNSNVLTTVNKAYTTVATPSASPASSAYGQSVTFSATVNITSPGGGSLSGNVVFYDWGSTLATVAISGASGVTVSTPTSSLYAGDHSITAKYFDVGGNYYDSSLSSALSFTVSRANTSIDFSYADSGYNGIPVWWYSATATVNNDSGTGATPTGILFFNFTDGGLVSHWYACALSSGSCNVNFTTSWVYYNVYAYYYGDVSFNAASNNGVWRGTGR